MAVLKSLFTSLAKSASLPKGFVSAHKRRPERDAFALGPWILLLACLIGFGAGSGSREQSPAAVTPPGTQNQPESSAKAQSLLQQGAEHVVQKDYAGAEAAFREAIEDDPTLAAAHRELGLALWAQGHPAAAWKELRLAARLDPRDANVHYALGKLAWLLYQEPAAREAEIQGLSPDDFQSLALSEIEKAVTLAPGNFKMRLDLAELTLAVGHDKQAQTQAEEAIPLATSHVDRSLAHVTMARALLATGDEDGAQREYQKALAENPKNASAYLNLGQLRLFQHKSMEAANYFRQAIATSPDLQPAYVALAQLLTNAHQPAEARALFEKAVTLDPKDWHTRYEFALLLMDAGQSSRAKDILTGIAAHQEDFLPAREQLALLLLRQGDLTGAQAQAQDLIARNPQAGEGHRVMALVLWRERKIEPSLSECAMALAVDPHSTSMLALQAIALWQEKQKQNAQAAFREAARTDPSIASGSTFCRLIACDSRDIPLVDEFLRKNRWVLNPPEAQ
ncbi:MAG TPA: tetratricopeptide repeat protein [Terriglobia bacterium]|nr:tetratricopeptide repeat protein [Terriglobia bacterium]